MIFERGGALDPLGPRFLVHITIPTRAANTRWKDTLKTDPFGLVLLIDTGATATSIKEEALKFLGLVSHERTFVRTMSHAAHPADVWEIDLVFDEHTIFRNLKVLGCGAMGHVDGVLGRDILNHGVFKYDGGRKRWSLKLQAPMTIIGDG